MNLPCLRHDTSMPAFDCLSMPIHVPTPGDAYLLSSPLHVCLLYMYEHISRLCRMPYSLRPIYMYVSLPVFNCLPMSIPDDTYLLLPSAHTLSVFIHVYDHLYLGCAARLCSLPISLSVPTCIYVIVHH